MVVTDESQPRGRPVAVRPGAPVPRRAPAFVRLTLGAPAAVAFGALALARRARALHPVGVAFEAVLVLDGPGAAAVPELGSPGSRRVGVVRFSRGGGLPEGWPDIHGVAIRLNARETGGRDQDLLLSSSARSIVGRRLLVPARSFDDVWTSSLTGFDVGGRRVVWAARVLPANGSTTVEALRREPARAPAVTLMVATPAGPWECIGTLSPGDVLSPDAEDALAFSPWQDGDGIVPRGLLNLLRDGAYRASRIGRGTAAVSPWRRPRWRRTTG
jgi:hypothetical protein